MTDDTTTGNRPPFPEELRRWNYLTEEQRRFAESKGTTRDTLTLRQFEILRHERPSNWGNYEWDRNTR